MSKRNQRILRRVEHNNTSSSVSVDDISGLEKFHKKPRSKEEDKENNENNECNKEEVNKLKQVMEPSAEKNLSVKLADVTSTPFHNSRIMPLTKVFQEEMSPIAPVAAKISRPQTKIPVLKSKIPTLIPQSVQSGTTAVGLMRQKTEVDLPLKPHTAPSLGPVRSSLPNRGIVKGKFGEPKARVRQSGKQGDRNTEKKGETAKETELVGKNGGGDVKPAKKPNEKNVNVGQEEQSVVKKADKLLNEGKETVHELNKTRVLVSAPAGAEGGSGRSTKPASTSEAAQQNLQPVRDVTFIKQVKEVKTVNKKPVANKKTIDNVKILHSEVKTEEFVKGFKAKGKEAETAENKEVTIILDRVNIEERIEESVKVVKAKAKEPEIESKCLDSDVVLASTGAQEYSTTDSAPKKIRKTTQKEIKATKEEKVCDTLPKAEHSRPEVNGKETNEICDKPNKRSEIKEIKLSGAVREMPKPSVTVEPSGLEDGKTNTNMISEHTSISNTKHTSAQLIDAANTEDNVENVEMPAPGGIDDVCDMVLKVRTALCKQKGIRKPKRQSKQKEDSKVGNINSEEELMMSLFGLDTKPKLVLEKQKQESVPLKRKAKPEGNENSKRGKKNVQAAAGSTSPLTTGNSEKLQIPQARSKKPTAAAKRQIKEKPFFNDERGTPNEDEVPLREPAPNVELQEQRKRKSRKQVAVEKSVAPDKPDEEDGLNPEPTAIVSKPEEPERKRRTTASRKQTKGTAKGKIDGEKKVDCMSDDKYKLEAVQSTEGSEAVKKEDEEDPALTNKEINLEEGPVETDNKAQRKYKAHTPDNKERKKIKVDSSSKTKPDDCIKVSDENNVNSDQSGTPKLKEENPEKENKQKPLPKERKKEKPLPKAISKKRNIKISKQEITESDTVQAPIIEKNSEAQRAEQEPLKRSRVPRKTKKDIQKQAEASNHDEENFNLQLADECRSALTVLTEGSGEEKGTLKKSTPRKTTLSEKRCEIKRKVDINSESRGIHSIKANGEIKEEATNRKVINKKRKIKEVEEDKDDDNHNKEQPATTRPSNSHDRVEHSEGSVPKRLQSEKCSTDERYQLVGRNYSKLSVQNGEARRSFANRSGFKKFSERWFSSDDVNFVEKDNKESGVLFAKCLSIHNTVAAGYIHIESGQTFSGMATNNTVYLIQKGSVRVDIGGETRSLKRWQFFIIVPGVPFSVKNKSETSSVHLSYVKFRSVDQ